MSEINDFLNLLKEPNDNYFSNNDEDDLEKVMEICFSEAKPHLLRFEDGSYGYLSFEENI